MPAKVVDASVLAAMAFGESRAAEAKELISGCEVFAPDFLPYEVCSVAYKKVVRQNLAEAGSALDSLRTILSLGITLLPVPKDALLSLALATGLTAYDAAYLYVARNLRCPLGTFDEWLARALA